MFLSCFDVKIDKWISKNSETSKLKIVWRALHLNALKSSRYDEKWWVYKMQIRQIQTQLWSLFLISGYACFVIDEYMQKEVNCMM